MSGSMPAEQPARPIWSHVGIFLVLTFGLAWLLDLGIYLHGGLKQPGIVTALQLQMLLPASSATVLGMFFFRESPLHRSREVGPGRWFYRFVLALTGMFAVCVAVMWLVPRRGVFVAVGAVAPIAGFLGLVLLIVLRIVAGRGEMARVGIAWGGARFYIVLGLGVVGFYVLQAVLNGLLGLGPARFGSFPTPPGLGRPAALLLAGLQSVVLAPFIGIVLAFGEEYGWRGYLQRELVKLGRVRGVLIVGAIWGAWHWPIILMGWSYPGYPLVGLLLAVLFLMGFAVVLGFALLRTGSIVLVAFLHALNDQTTAYLVFLGFKPDNPVFSFGVGIYGVATLAVVAILFVVLSGVWRKQVLAGRESAE